METQLLIFSDLHFGSEQAKVSLKDIFKVIDLYQPKKVIFMGDTFDFIVDIKKATELFFELMSFINYCKLDVVFIQGNHDFCFKIVTYEFEINDKKILLFHGHKRQMHFTTIWVTRLNNWFLKYFRVNFQSILRTIVSKNYPEGKFVPSLYNEMLEIINKYKDSEYNIVFSGHTHYLFNRKNISFEYQNLGCFKNYILVNSIGEFEVKQI